MNWIKNNFLPIALLALGYVANDSDAILAFLKEINAPLWAFNIVKYIGMAWAAFKLFNAKSSKIKKEIQEALSIDPNDKEAVSNFIGTPNVPKTK